MKTFAVILLLVFSFAIILSAQGKGVTEKSREEIIAQGVEIRLESFRKRKMQDCRERAIERAVVMADSIIRVRVLEKMGLTTEGDKPFKPDKPEFKKLKDTLELKPLFDKDSARIDSSGR